MGLNSLHLDAFAEIVRSKSFSIAAKKLFVTQSALSQRLMNLESELGTSLLIRDPSGIRLTAAGESLVRYCRTRAALEDEFLSEIAADHRQSSSLIRIGGFSSVMRSLVLPCLDESRHKNSQLRVQFFTREVRELPRMLLSGEIDIALTIDAPNRHDIETKLIGHEENILVESKAIKSNQANIYLDHDEEDSTTIDYLKAHGVNIANIQRIFLDEIYAIIDAVLRGWGRAVIPKHMIATHRKIGTVKGFKPIKSPVHLCFIRQPYYTKAMQGVVDALARIKFQ